MSSRYAFIPTPAVIEPLLEAGFIIQSVRQNGVKDDPYGTHRITLEMPRIGDMRALIGEVRPTIHVINNHSGFHRLKISCGLEVCICTNQAHAPFLSSEMDAIHRGRRFSGDHLVADLLTNQNNLAMAVHNMQATRLSPTAREHFAMRALMHAGNHAHECFVQRADALPLLIAQRESQREDHTLWTTYNVVQENLIERGRSGRGVHEILRNERLNIALWQEAQAILN